MHLLPIGRRRFRPRIPRVAVATLASLLVFGLSGTPSEAGRPVDQIKHVLVLMQENRSFDHYLGHLKDFDPTLDVEAEPAGASNPDPTNPSGPPVTAFHKTEMCEVADLDHSWNGSHIEWDNGAMDGFTEANAVPQDPTGSRTMGYYTEKDLPFYYWLYDTFAMGDRYFQSVLSQTFPNRFYLLAGTSFGHIRNDVPTDPQEFAPPNGTIFERLDHAGVSWRIYYAQVPFAFVFAYVRNHAAGHVFPISQYFADAAAGALPQVSFIDPIFIATNNVENDEHPPSNVQVGQKFVHDAITALFASPNWPSSALFLTYDEHGGFYDHVPPPAAVPPDDIPPMLEPGDIRGSFDRYGFRDPVTVVSPFSKRHFVSHRVHDHTSILKFIESRFRLGTLTARDAAADPMLEFFNFSRPAFTNPPTNVPEAVIDPGQAAICETRETSREPGL
jgi:phospholipase C